MNSSISQEEIAALFGTASAPAEAASPLTPEEIDALGEIGNICMGTAATTLCEILGRRVRITTPRVKVINLADLASQYQIPFVIVEVSYTEGLEGNNVLILREDDVRLITDLMMGGEGVVNSEEELGELHLSAISETMNQMMGSSATSMSDMLGKSIQISPPRSTVAKIGDECIHTIFPDSGDIVQVSFSLEIEGLANSEIMQLMPIWFGRELVNALMNPDQEALAAGAAPAPEPAAAEPAAPPPEEQSDAAPEAPAPAPEQRRAPPPERPAPTYTPPAQPRQQGVVDAQRLSFTSFDDDFADAGARDDGINLIIDVPMQVTIELGKCRKTVKEILEFNLGTILVLEKLAGEPVEIVVNDKLIARGEVIQIDDNYGVRITEILNKIKGN
jgi:flagellar motor switch protein FliN/FliY